MPNIAALLKNEISRIARKELRSEVAGLRKAVAAHRSELAELKRIAHALGREVRAVRKLASAKAAQPVPPEEQTNVRFSAKGFAAHRRRLGLSAADCGVLLGVSGQSVYKWESGSARPRSHHLPAIAALRRLTKSEAAARVAEIRGTP